MDTSTPTLTRVAALRFALGAQVMLAPRLPKTLGVKVKKRGQNDSAAVDDE